MRKKILFIFGMMLLLNCNMSNKSNVVKLYFNFYNNKNVRTETNMYVVERKKIDLFDSVFVYKKNIKVLSFRENMENDGIYRYINNKKTLSHSLNDSLSLKIDYGVSFIPFINKETTLINKRTYVIRNKHYKIYHYSEVENIHKGFDSYYLENVGFICYYDFDTDRYILCDSTNIKTLKIKEITNELIKDKEFFARFTGARVFPNFYRPKDNSKEL
jgi:hypothetical protein